MHKRALLTTLCTTTARTEILATCASALVGTSGNQLHPQQQHWQVCWWAVYLVLGGLPGHHLQASFFSQPWHPCLLNLWHPWPVPRHLAGGWQRSHRNGWPL